MKKNRAELNAEILPDRLGSFRAELSVDGFPNSETEFVFSVLPKPRTMGIDRHSWLAAMPESKEYVLASLQRAGFKWMQNIRDTQVARWMYAEPEQGKIVWHDELVRRSRRHGIEPVILLHVNYNRLPKWVKPTAANKNVPQDVSLWKSFVSRMVEHYKGQVKYWQLSDDIHHYFTADEYAMLLKATWEAAKKSDPDCVVIGWRFFNREVPGWEEAFKRTEPYSDIIYAGDKQLRQKYGKQLHSYRFISAPTMYNFPALGAGARLASLAKGRSAACTGLVRAFCDHADSVGYVDALFYYMAYLGTPSYVTNRSKQTFEHCGAIHLGAVTLRMLDHFLYRMECIGNISPSKDVAAYHFRRGNDSCVVAWSTEGQKVALNFSERLTGLKVFNAMGNPIKPDRRGGRTTLSLYDTPIFISWKAVSPERMATLFKNVDSKLELAVHPVLSAKGGRLRLDTLVTNNTRRTTKVELKVAGPRYFPLKWNAPTEVWLSLKKGQDQTASFPLKYGLSRSAEFKNMQLDVGAGDGLSYSKRWVLWLMNSRPRTVPVNLDGKLDEWNSVRSSRITTTHVSGATRRMRQVRTGAITSAEELTQGLKPIIRGPEDISVKARSQWDDQKIYFACEVRDDAVEEGDTDVAGDRADESLSNDDLVFTCAVSHEGNIVGKLKRSEVSSDIPVACRQNDQGYVIEFAVPWKSLNIKPAAGTTIGFDIAVTDTDKGSLHAQVVWAGASYNWGNPMGFGTLVLGE